MAKKKRKPASIERQGTKYKKVARMGKAATGLSTRNIGKAKVNQYTHLENESLWD